MTLVEWFRTIAFALNDDEPGNPFVRYPFGDMIAAYNDALCLVQQYRGDLFTEWKIIRLVPGKYQDARGCCSKILKVNDQTDASGNVIRELKGSRDTKTTVKRLWKKPSCLQLATEDGYLIQTAAVERNMNGRFTVYPPVPCGVAAYVRAECVTSPCKFNVDQANIQFDGGCTYNVAIWHYVLARMLAGDRFVNAAGGNAQYHFRTFYDTLGIQQKQEDRIESKEQA